MHLNCVIKDKFQLNKMHPIRLHLEEREWIQSNNTEHARKSSVGYKSDHYE